MNHIKVQGYFPDIERDERKIQERWRKGYKKTFGIFLDKLKNTENNKFFNELKNYSDTLFQDFNGAYGIIKNKFKYIIRDSGKRGFDHLVGSLEEYLENLSNFKEKLENLNFNNRDDRVKGMLYLRNEIDRITTILAHDLLEDTDTTFEELKGDFGKKVAFGVLLVTKKSFCEFIDDEEDKKKIEEMKDIGMLNDKLYLSDRFRLKLYLEKRKDLEYETKAGIFRGEDFSLIPKEKELYLEWKRIGKKYKKIRNDDYFKERNSFKNFYKLAKKLEKKLGLSFSREELTEIVINAIYTKIADRINNLSDMLKTYKDKQTKIEWKLIESTDLLSLTEKFGSLRQRLLEVIKEVGSKLNIDMREYINTQYCIYYPNDIVDNTRTNVGKTLQKA